MPKQSRYGLSTVVLCLIPCPGFVPLAVAQTRPELISLANTPAALYRPVGGAAPHVGIVYQNGAGSMTMLGCSEMARRGFLVLCTPGLNVDGQNGWEETATTIKLAIDFLHQQPGITKTVLYAHSGGGATASFYQAVAENGVAFCQDPEKLSRCGDDLANLPPADGVLFPDAHPGLGVMDLRDINPSVVVDGNPRKLRIIPELDPRNPKNGFNPDGPSRYSREFQERYAKAQGDRMKELLDRALAIREQERSGKLDDPTQDIMVLYSGGGRGHLDEYDPDTAGTMSTVRPRKLLRNDGTIVTQIVKSVMGRGPRGAAMAPGGPGPGRGAPANAAVAGVRTFTVAAFLSRGSVRATDGIDAIDYCSSNSATVCNAGYIHVPVLFIPSGASTFIADEERMYERSPAKDKDFIVVEGIGHTAEPCKPCETTPGQYANGTKNFFDYMANWINTRFPADAAANKQPQ